MKHDKKIKFAKLFVFAINVKSNANVKFHYITPKEKKKHLKTKKSILFKNISLHIQFNKINNILVN